jgi:hypothetical protein
MSKTIRDHITGADVTCNLIGNTITLCANGRLLTETVRGADYTAAKVAFAKRDLEGFGTLFDRHEKREAA